MDKGKLYWHGDDRPSKSFWWIYHDILLNKLKATGLYAISKKIQNLGSHHI